MTMAIQQAIINTNHHHHHHHTSVTIQNVQFLQEKQFQRITVSVLVCWHCLICLRAAKRI